MIDANANANTDANASADANAHSPAPAPARARAPAPAPAPALALALLLAACSGSDASPTSTSSPDGGSPSADGGSPSASDGGSSSRDAAPGTNPAACNPVANDCVEAAAPKCTLAGTPPALAPACRASFGAEPPGAPCARQGDVVGDDDCATGAFCTDVGGAATCRAFCHADADCAGGAKAACVLLTSGAPAVGVCLPACTPFGGDCPNGSTCTEHAPDTGVPQTTAAAFCRPAGATPLGASCTADPEGCGANAGCVFFPDKGEAVSDSKCHPECDGAHACAAGACIIKPGDAFGFCDG